MKILKPTKEWKELYSDYNNPQLFRKWLCMVLDSKTISEIGTGYSKSGISQYAGYLTYRYIYDRDTIELVALREKFIIYKYGYDFSFYKKL